MKEILHDVNTHRVRLTAFASLALLLAAGCGGKQSVASKSAAAYQEALKKGLPVGEGGHGGHDASEKAGMAGMDHSKMKQGGGMSGMAGMDHSKMKQGGGMSGMAGMDHSKMKQGGMDGMPMGDPITGAIVADKSAAPTPGRAASILSSDLLDAPAATAVEDAQRSAQMNEMMTSGDGMTMSHGTYVHRDAGRDENAPQQPMDHSGGAPKVTPAKPGASTREGASQPDHGMKESATERGSVAVYVCPMHPEVQSPTPGKCPKCGMTLTKKGKR